ncbi:hypothetical protein [Parafilimonas sp.]|uniref:hypothetical protein n=1 Tax=Parafilimonas sp. TaxID=1969739 RepID=UPI003F7F4BE4
MKNTMTRTAITLFIFGYALIATNCKKPETTPTHPDNPGDSILTGIHPDSVADRLHFLNTTKIAGSIPDAPANNSLKISFKDTLFLLDTFVQPVKFFHTDKNENVAGIYVQIFIGGSGGIFESSYYYDVPETTPGSDSISIIYIGFKEDGFVPPPGCLINIAPYDEDKKIIAEATRPLVITEHEEVNNPGNNGSCGLVTPSDESWVWETTISYAQAGKLIIYEPGVRYDYDNPNPQHTGQDILGCCIEGESHYGAECLSTDSSNQRILNFATGYSINSESFKFFDNGRFHRITIEKSVNPAPEESDFCGNGPGVVKDKISAVTYEGNWAIETTPPYRRWDTKWLSLLTTSSSDPLGGFGNAGGYIHQLNCRMKPPVLVLIEPGREGEGELIKIYDRVNDDRSKRWFPFL